MKSHLKIDMSANFARACAHLFTLVLHGKRWRGFRIKLPKPMTNFSLGSDSATVHFKRLASFLADKRLDDLASEN
jgi:hypothetical protein